MKDEIFRQHRTAEDRYTYFLLAAAAAGIGLAVQRTTGAVLAWSMLPIGLAVACWGLSFYCGCVHLQYVSSTLFANMALLQAEDGTLRDIPRHPDAFGAAAAGIRSAIESNSEKMSRWARAQFRLLILGAVLFVTWHVIELDRQATPAAPTTATAKAA
jgi:hypothetical protein